MSTGMMDVGRNFISRIGEDLPRAVSNQKPANEKNLGVPLPSAGLILEDDPAIAAGLCEALMLAFPGVKPYVASTPAQAHMLALNEGPQIAVVQLGVGGDRGLEFVRAFCVRTPSMHIVAAADPSKTGQIFSALRAGARGYLLVPEQRESMMRQLRAMLLGELPLTPPIAYRFLEWFDDETNAVPISGAERELLMQITAGRSLRDVAWRIEGGHGEAQNHVRRLYAKLTSKSHSDAGDQAAQNQE